MMTNLNPFQATPLPMDVPTRTEDSPARVRAEHATVPAVPAGSSVERANATIAAVTAQLEKHLAGLRAEDYTPQGLRNQITGFGDTPAAKAVDAAVALVEQRADTARAAVDAARRALLPSGDDVAAELRNTRYWDRTRRLLDVAKDPTSTAEKLIKDAQPEQLGVLVDELGPYLESRGSSAEWIDSALDRAAPAYGQARKTYNQAQKALMCTRHNATELRNRINTTHAPAGYRRPTFLDATAYDPD